jgi:hypothetical protein
MPASHSVMAVLLRGWEAFLYTLKAGPAGGRLRRPSSRRQRPLGRLTDAVRQYTQAPERPCKHHPPEASNAYCHFRINGASFPSPDSARVLLHSEGGLLLGRRHDHSQKAKGEA